MTTVCHQCCHCLVGVWYESIEDGLDASFGRADSDCGCADEAERREQEELDDYDD